MWLSRNTLVGFRDVCITEMRVSLLHVATRFSVLEPADRPLFFCHRPLRNFVQKNNR